ncbi:hypothetical protein Y032_0040g297 [Ancylostoma ceylanicum]|uniref:Uncharacterized protein n=1 Tax=Ancylostoma ceylanicum TaxID=53326 RepID=A0A016UI99_9BILA|nr:hypothetical protein Y032_0040g297 [Ancylostoma ceylanicum]
MVGKFAVGQHVYRGQTQRYKRPLKTFFVKRPRVRFRGGTLPLKAMSHLRHTGRELALGRCTRRLPPFGNENTSAIDEISRCVWQNMCLPCRETRTRQDKLAPQKRVS